MNDHIPSGLGAVDRVDSGAGAQSVHQASAVPSEASIVVALTPDEISALLEELRGFHDESDFEPECAVCWAFKKLQAAYAAATGGKTA